MNDTLAQRTKDKLAKIYGGGIVLFIAIFGVAIPFVMFFANLK